MDNNISVIDHGVLEKGLEKNGDYNYYAIMAISKRAREIVEDSEKCPDNPVMEALKEFEDGKFVIELNDD